MDINAQIEARIAAVMAMPMTHAVVATYECGKVYRFETRSEGSAKNHAHSWFRKIGKSLINRETGKNVKVVSVEIVEL